MVGASPAALSEPFFEPSDSATEAYTAPPEASTTARTDATTVLRRLSLRRFSSRRCCCRTYFSLASCRRR